jgi:hypothetical protein
VNPQKEPVGTIDWFVIGRDNRAMFAALEVGDLMRLGGHLVAVPFRHLELDGAGGKIILPGVFPMSETRGAGERSKAS